MKKQDRFSKSFDRRMEKRANKEKFLMAEIKKVDEKLDKQNRCTIRISYFVGF